MPRRPAGKSKNPGPEPDRLKLNKCWEQAIGDALSKPVPPEGIPEPPGKGTRPRKKKSSC